MDGLTHIPAINPLFRSAVFLTAVTGCTSEGYIADIGCAALSRGDYVINRQRWIPELTVSTNAILLVLQIRKFLTGKATAIASNPCLPAMSDGSANIVVLLSPFAMLLSRPILVGAIMLTTIQNALSAQFGAVCLSPFPCAFLAMCRKSACALTGQCKHRSGKSLLAFIAPFLSRRLRSIYSVLLVVSVIAINAVGRQSIRASLVLPKLRGRFRHFASYAALLTRNIDVLSFGAVRVAEINTGFAGSRSAIFISFGDAECFKGFNLAAFYTALFSGERGRICHRYRVSTRYLMATGVTSTASLLRSSNYSINQARLCLER